MKLDKQFPVEQFEATVSQSTVPSPLLIFWGEGSPAQEVPGCLDLGILQRVTSPEKRGAAKGGGATGYF